MTVRILGCMWLWAGQFHDHEDESRPVSGVNKTWRTA